MRVRVLEEQIDNDTVQVTSGTTLTGFSGRWSTGRMLPFVPTPGKHRLRVKVELSTGPTATFGNNNAPPATLITDDLIANFQVTGG
ncbi:MAG: hypothetical protein JWL69_3944 [Phycisphaerales bacterium]|jgi:hypothetical protein|nr:hypothetical protein [Phycisphaerales bacterium]MDB5334269.1 hypothetical protein [Phycisphaerales bacterium]